ncbi:MAG: lamin tail domain-containing protein [Gemmatimonadaceae bacterium]
MHRATVALAALGAVLLAVCGRAGDDAAGGARGASGGAVAQARPRVMVTEIMADPRAVPDERGEWIEVHNAGDAAVDLAGWTIRSRGDTPHRVARSVPLAPGAWAVLARDARVAANGGVRAAYEYGGGIALANGADWVVIADGAGRTVDSVAWRAPPAGASLALGAPGQWGPAGARFGGGDRGTPGAANPGFVSPVSRQVAGGPRSPGGAPPEGQGSAAGAAARDHSAAGDTAAPPGDPRAPAELVVRVLDVGQGDAVLITNGTSRVLVDGGPDPRRMGALLDSLGLNGAMLDVVVLTHPHYDHHAGLREVFAPRRRIRVRYFFETKDAYANQALARLRDLVRAREARGELVYRDADDPCGDGRAVCTITMNGGARLRILRPAPIAGDGPNDRSVPIKLVGPDSASFTMWLAGDAEHDAIAWFDRAADYDRAPGMRADVLKADHHGSCNGVTRRYLEMVRPSWIVASVASPNDYGHVHEQAMALWRAAGIPWYRTDRNGTITIRTPGTPGGGYRVEPQRGTRDMRGTSDRASTQPECRDMS